MMTIAQTLCPDFSARTGCNQHKGPGTVVEIGNNRGPRYEIVAIDAGEAWVRPLAFGTAGLARLETLRVVGA